MMGIYLHDLKCGITLNKLMSVEERNGVDLAHILTPGAVTALHVALSPFHEVFWGKVWD